jgi:hypothetical protein
MSGFASIAHLSLLKRKRTAERIRFVGKNIGLESRLLNLFGRAIFDGAIERREPDWRIELVQRVQDNVREEYLREKQPQLLIHSSRANLTIQSEAMKALTKR